MRRLKIRWLGVGAVVLGMQACLAQGASISVNNLFSQGVGEVRVGTSVTDTLSIQRSGPTAHGAVTGLFPQASGPFSPGSTLAYSVTANGAGNAATRAYTFAPTSRGVFTTDYVVTASQGGNKTTTFKGVGVGPVYDVVLGNSVGPNGFPLLDFGIVRIGKGATLPLTISNITTDGVIAQDKTTLSLNIAALGGSEASSFALPLFVLSTKVLAGKSYELQLNTKLDATMGHKWATLLISTDQNAAFGGNGASFSYDVHAFVTPEPSSLLLAVSGVLGLGFWSVKRRRRPIAAGSR